MATARVTSLAALSTAGWSRRKLKSALLSSIPAGAFLLGAPGLGKAQVTIPPAYQTLTVGGRASNGLGGAGGGFGQAGADADADSGNGGGGGGSGAGPGGRADTPDYRSGDGGAGGINALQIDGTTQPVWDSAYLGGNGDAAGGGYGSGGGAGGYALVIGSPAGHPDEQNTNVPLTLSSSFTGGTGGAGDISTIGQYNQNLGGGGDGGGGVVALQGGLVLNTGTVLGGTGGTGFPSGRGGAGIETSAYDLVNNTPYSADLTNQGSITGGTGGAGIGSSRSQQYYPKASSGGVGGAGVALVGGGSVTNQGTGVIAGGDGGQAGIAVDAYGHIADSSGGDGGDGVLLYQDTSASIANGSSAIIRGGTGGAAADNHYSGTGGVGVDLNGANLQSFQNDGQILGGAGGVSMPGPDNNTMTGSGGNGGTAVDLSSGTGTTTLFNSTTGKIVGGTGGAGNYGGNGGTGLYDSSGGDFAIQNDGIIQGGLGGASNGQGGYGDGYGQGNTTSGGFGGTGLYQSTGATIRNTGKILGGDGGLGLFQTERDINGTLISVAVTEGGGGGTAIEIDNVSDHDATLINSGTIQGGAGAAGYSTGLGGVGISFYGNGTITNSGTIAGGLGGNGQADAIDFSYGTHTLLLKTGATFGGNVDASNPGYGDGYGGFHDTTLQLDGGGIGIVDLSQFIGFNHLSQTGGSGGEWTLTGTGTFERNSDDVAPDAYVDAGTMILADGSRLLNLVSMSVYTGGTLSMSDANSLGYGTTPLLLDGGTLQITGTNLHELANPFTFGNNGGTFDITDGGNVFTEAATLGGPGALTKVGDGTLVLTGTNSYAGGTNLKGGTLQVAGNGNLGAASGGLTFDGGFLETTDTFTTARTVTITGNGGGFIPDAGTTLTVAGAISGAGPLTVAGAGTLALPNANSYQGGTLLDEGTLAIGNAGSIGTGTLTMAPDTTLAFTNSFTLANAIVFAGATDPTIDTGANNDTISGSISGPGSLTKQGSGTLTLTGVNTYSGGTTIAAGTLVGSATSFGSGPITDNAALVFDQGTDGSFANAIGGGGTVTKIGAGTLDLTGTSTYTGATTVAAGNLLVDGSVANSVVTVEAGSGLGGSGTIGGLIVQNGATVAPGLGTPFSTLAVGGNVTFQPGSTLRVQINAAGQTDAVAATGTATIGGGTVDVLAGDGLYQVGTTYSVLTAQGGRTGTFNTLTTTSNLAFLSPELTYTPNAVNLGFRPNGVTFPTVAATPNQQAAAGGLQSLGPTNSLYNAVLSQSAAGARQAFDATSGEAHASVVSAALTDARFISTSILDRLWNVGGGGPDALQVLQQFGPATLPTLVRCYAPVDPAAPVNPSTYSAWGQAIGQWGQHDGNGNAARLDRSLGGFVVGLDAPIYASFADVLRVGAAAGYSSDSFHAKTRGSSGTYESAFGTLYGAARFSAFDLRLGASYSGNTTDMNRTVAFPGFFESEHSNYGGSTVQGFGEIGYRFAIGQNVFEPIAGFTAVHVHQDGYRETGGVAALTGRKSDTDLQTTILGFRGEAAPFAGMPLVARVLLGWQHGFGDLDPSTVVAFASGSTPFSVSGTPLDRDTAVGEIALDYRFTNAATLEVSYTGEVGRRDNQNAIRGKLDYRF